jgi:mRNA export factor
MSSFGRAAAADKLNSHVDLSADVKLMSPPDDTISSLSWSLKADFLAASSWDHEMRVYDMTSSPTGEGRALVDFDGPVPSCDWLVVSKNCISW